MKYLTNVPSMSAPQNGIAQAATNVSRLLSDAVATELRVRKLFDGPHNIFSEFKGMWVPGSFVFVLFTPTHEVIAHADILGKAFDMIPPPCTGQKFADALLASGAMARPIQ